MLSTEEHRRMLRLICGNTLIFIRKEGWYPVDLPNGVDLAEAAAEHAALNPGTIRVEDIDGTVLWRLQ